MGKDCGRGNEQLGAKELALNKNAEGEVNLPAWISLSKCRESNQWDL